MKRPGSGEAIQCSLFSFDGALRGLSKKRRMRIGKAAGIFLSLAQYWPGSPIDPGPVVLVQTPGCATWAGRSKRGAVVAPTSSLDDLLEEVQIMLDFNSILVFSGD